MAKTTLTLIGLSLGLLIFLPTASVHAQVPAGTTFTLDVQNRSITAQALTLLQAMLNRLAMRLASSDPQITVKEADRETIRTQLSVIRGSLLAMNSILARVDTSMEIARPASPSPRTESPLVRRETQSNAISPSAGLESSPFYQPALSPEPVNANTASLARFNLDWRGWVMLLLLATLAIVLFLRRQFLTSAPTEGQRDALARPVKSVTNSNNFQYGQDAFSDEFGSV